MLVTLKEIMEIAEAKKIAVGAFNATSLQSLEAIISAAEELNVPVIIQHAQCHESIVPLKVIAPIMLHFAKEATVPVCVHLDHGETLEYLQTALELGFTGIMFDGSGLSYEENAAYTKVAVRMAKEHGAYVEAEMGSMGRRESGTCEEATGAEDDTKIYTDPEEAKRFVEETGICALACSFGTTHGIYISKPQLDFGIVTKVRELADHIPVVMHGGSGVSTEEFRKAVESGVRKINYFTYMDKAAGMAVIDSVKEAKDGEPIFYTAVAAKARDYMREDVKKAMKVFADL